MGGIGACAVFVIAAAAAGGACRTGGGVLVGTAGTNGTGVITTGRGGAPGTVVGTAGSGPATTGSAGSMIIIGAGGSAIVTGAGGSGNVCDGTPHSAQPLPPNIVIALDTSASMNDPFDPSCSDCSSKWNATFIAIYQVVGKTLGAVDWGLVFLSSAQDACGPEPAVPVGQAAAILDPLAKRAPGGVLSVTGNRPTRAAVNVAATLASAGPPTARAILLLTDGAPNCMAGAPAADDTAAAVSAVSAALANDVYTFVIGLGALDAAADTALSALAIAGGFSRAGPPVYFPATSQNELEDAMNVLVAATAECFYSVPDAGGGIASRDHIGVVAGEGRLAIPQNETNGWTYTDSSHAAIQLHGSACDTVRDGALGVSVVFHCLIP